ncbi:RlpA-like double-psi beta-barrel-protein domain-containing protein-containing protein [Hysterangium stoloniferum]|nr:RlpA-like double-psi beta-barrel-protein domain-containing protein-containing protein [Hysterangium stoloniferum]
MYFPPVVFVSLVASASALVTPHVPSGLNRRSHASIAKARAAEPAPVDVGLASAAIPKRQITKRCKSRPTSGITRATPSATDPPASTPSDAPPQNVAPLPVPVSIPGVIPSVSIGNPSKASPSPSPKPKTSTPAPAPAPAPSSPSGGSSSDPYSGSHSGDGTFYSTGLGACGITNNDNQPIVAISEILFDNAPGYNGQNPNKNPLCGRKLNVNYQGKTATVEVTDRCTGCSQFSLDFSPSVFNSLSDPSVGRLHQVEWSWA